MPGGPRGLQNRCWSGFVRAKAGSIPVLSAMSISDFKLPLTSLLSPLCGARKKKRRRTSALHARIERSLNAKFFSLALLQKGEG